MSDIDLEEVPPTNCFDSESDFPEISSVNTTPHQGVNVSPLSVNTHHEKRGWQCNGFSPQYGQFSG